MSSHVITKASRSSNTAFYFKPRPHFMSKILWSAHTIISEEIYIIITMSTRLCHNDKDHISTTLTQRNNHKKVLLIIFRTITAHSAHTMPWKQPVCGGLACAFTPAAKAKSFREFCVSVYPRALTLEKGSISEEKRAILRSQSDGADPEPRRRCSR